MMGSALAKGRRVGQGRQPKGTDLQGKRIILGSGSPRRRELLTHVGFAFEVESPDIDEGIRSKENPSRYVKRMALEKADRIWAKAPWASEGAKTVTITADTSVVVDDIILGKPLNFEDAVRMLGRIQGKWHRVMTAVCVRTLKKSVVFVVTTRVKVAPMSLATRQAYVQTGEPLDKAGSYAAQGVGMCFLERIVGSYSNVIGLPMVELLACLKKDFRVTPPVSH